MQLNNFYKNSMFKKYLMLLAALSLWSIAGMAFAGGNDLLPASAVPQATEPDFSPPPVPEFMLRQQEKPLTLEEMQQHAEEAARRVRPRNKPVSPPQRHAD